MKKSVAIVVGVIIIAAVVVGVLMTRNNNKDTGSQSQPSNTNTATTNNSTNSGSSAQPTATDKISITNFSFSPSSITVKKGTTVTWTNNDSVPHQPVADSGSGPNSPVLNNGQTYTFTYDTVGNFAYHCAIHPEMHGSVTVTE